MTNKNDRLLYISMQKTRHVAQNKTFSSMAVLDVGPCTDYGIDTVCPDDQVLQRMNLVMYEETDCVKSGEELQNYQRDSNLASQRFSNRWKKRAPVVFKTIASLLCRVA